MKTTMAPAVTPELLDAEQAATLTGRGKRTWWRHVAAGLAPQPVRMSGPGGLVRWRRADLLTWIENGCPRVRKAVADHE
jgi:predicted DNA-binding transcriptional regulator AlpA